MLVKLRAQHVIDNTFHEKDEVLDVAVVTPLMEGLDEAAREAIKAEKLRVFGRWMYDERGQYLLDNPPIERPLEENQPVRPAPVAGPG